MTVTPCSRCRTTGKQLFKHKHDERGKIRSILLCKACLEEVTRTEQATKRFKQKR